MFGRQAGNSACVLHIAKRAVLVLYFAMLPAGCAWAQQEVEQAKIEAPSPGEKTTPQLDVNWLYGAYVPKGAPLTSLTLRQRQKLFMRQTFTTPGIYVKSIFLGLINQAQGYPYEWGGGFEGYGRRVGSVYAQSAIQNLFSTAGNAALGYEPRYDRCRCDGSNLEPSTH